MFKVNLLVRPCLLLLLTLLFCFALPTFSQREQPAGPTQKRVLVLLESDSIKKSHSSFFDQLTEQGQKLTFKKTSDSDAQLSNYGEYLYDSLIIFGEKIDDLIGVDIDSILNFIDHGHSVLIATTNQASDLIKELAEECGVLFDPSKSSKNSFVIDHFHFDLSDQNGPHSLLVLDQSSFLSSSVLGSFNKNSTAPILYRGAGLKLKETNELVFPILSAQSTAFTLFGPNSSPHVIGRNTVLVAAMQARNNARVVISGSLELFSNKFFEKSVQSSTDAPSKNYQRSGNKEFTLAIARWTFFESGYLRVGNHSYERITQGATSDSLRILDDIIFTVEITEWNGSEWVPYVTKDVQFELVRLDPHIREFMLPDEAHPGFYKAKFTIPDVYGVFNLRLLHNKLGYKNLDWQVSFPVRPFRHDEYERFIPAAYPYYAGAFSMMFGFYIFSFFFLYHQDSSKTKKE